MSQDLRECGCCPGHDRIFRPIANPSGQASIDYRVGDYIAFHDALLAQIGASPTLKTWRARENTDYGIALLDLWAYLADILTFYQERIANEAFLRTATLRGSVLRLAALIDYRLGPGAAATTWLTFTLDKDKQLVLPKGLRVQSVPGPNEKPQRFETVEELVADARYNRVAISALPQPFNPVATGNSTASIALDAAAAFRKPLTRGEKLVLISPTVLEAKELQSVATDQRQVALIFHPPVQSADLTPADARLVSYDRVFAVFGANAPEVYTTVDPGSGPAGSMATCHRRTDDEYLIDWNAASPARPEIPLAQKVDDLKPGASILLAARGPNGTPLTRLTTITAAGTRPAATLEPLTGPVTHLTLGTAARSAPIAAVCLGRLYVFVVADDGAVWVGSRELTGSKKTVWESLGGGHVESIAVGVGASGQWRLFAVGADGAVCLLRQTGPGKHGGWETLASDGVEIVVARSRKAALALVLRDRSGAVRVLRERDTDNWNDDWQTLDRGMSRLAAAFDGEDVLHVFGIGPPSAIRHCEYHFRTPREWPIFKPDSAIGRPERLAVARDKDGCLTLFVHGQHHGLYHIQPSGDKPHKWVCRDRHIDEFAVGAAEDNIVVFARKGKTIRTAFEGRSAGAKHSRDFPLIQGEFDAIGAAAAPGPAITVLRTPEGAIQWWDISQIEDPHQKQHWNAPQSFGYPIWSPVDRRSLFVYELTREPLPLRAERFGEAIAGDTVAVCLSSLASIEMGRRILLDDEAHDPHLACVTATAVAGDSLLISFSPAVARPLRTRSAVLYANVAKATHGETVRDEVLGSGDASSRFLSMPLRKSPVTFVPRPGSPNGVASTLELRVGGVLWNEVPSLYGAGPLDRVYATALAHDGTMTVRFGGPPGAPPPTGKDNIVATYRQGLGDAGNLRGGALTTLLDHPAGLRSVVNLAQTEGGAVPETLDQARVSATSTVRTFGRIVSLRDFEDAARSLAMVAKARAYVDWDRDAPAVFLIVAGSSGTSLAAGLREIAASLDAMRDTNRRMRVLAHKTLNVELTLNVIADIAYTLDAVRGSAATALQDLFAFANRELGQSVFLSDVYRAMQACPGVVAADLEFLRPKARTDLPRMADVAVAPDMIAALDPTDATIRVSYGAF